MGLSLDLSSASDRSKFHPLPNGQYPVTIKQAVISEAKAGGRLPAGTQVINVQFEVDEDVMESLPELAKDDPLGNVYSKTVFKRYNIVKDKKYEHKETSDNILYGFLKSVGYTEEELKSGDFELDLTDLPGRECTAVVEQNSYEDAAGETVHNNNVKYVKAAGSESALV